jgi:16S rRNA (guanine1207-N2)-methyltransferase
MVTSGGRKPVLTESDTLLLEEIPDVRGKILCWDLDSAELVATLPQTGSDLVVVEDGLGAVRALPPGAAVHAAYPPAGPYDAVFLRDARDRERGRVQIAWSAASLSENGTLLLVGEKATGIKGYRRLLEERFGEVEGTSKRHRTLWRCRAPRGGEPPDIVPKPAYDVPGLGPVYTLPGVFARHALDRGTAALLETLPEKWRGERVLDLGCGSGVLALHAATRGAGRVTAVDSSALALLCTQSTLGGLTNAESVAAEADDGLNGLYDAVLCNPPLHRKARHALSLVRRFVLAAAGALREGGELRVVLRGELPAEGLLREPFRDRERLRRDGYLICRAVK